jgi:thiopurine S-methyltransferase
MSDLVDTLGKTQHKGEVIMDANFWHQRWEENDIGFHKNEVNSLLLKYFDKLSLAIGSRIFLPLCGKTRDISWLLSKGYRVVGAELSEKAITQLFDELEIIPKKRQLKNVTHYYNTNIDIFVGDIFDLCKYDLGEVNAIYDRAALVALPGNMRERYTQQLMKITDIAPQLMICFDYDQSQIEGPPFSIPDKEVEQHYQKQYVLTKLASIKVPKGLKGQCVAQENIWLLQKQRKSTTIPTAS